MLIYLTKLLIYTLIFSLYYSPKKVEVKPLPVICCIVMFMISIRICDSKIIYSFYSSFLLVVLADTVISSTTNLAVASANVVEQDTLVTFVRAVLQSVLAVVLRQELFSPHFKDILPLVEAPKVMLIPQKYKQMHMLIMQLLLHILQ